MILSPNHQSNNSKAEEIFKIPTPQSEAHIEKHENGNLFRWNVLKSDKKLIQHCDQRNIIGLMTDQDTVYTLTAKISSMPILPMPASSSPLLSYLKGDNRPWEPFYTLVCKEQFLFEEFIELTREGIHKWNEKMTPDLVQKNYVIYAQQTDKLEMKLRVDLCVIFNNHHLSSQQSLDQFLSRLEQFTISYIHIQEWFLWSCSAKLENIPLEHCLTAIDTPSIDKLNNLDINQSLVYLKKFFEFKEKVFDLNQINIKRVQSLNLEQNASWYKGYIDQQTVQEYFNLLKSFYL